MIDNIQQGKFEGIIAWHPDRLARNMKDAGEIIDLLDKNIIKDFKFVTHTFSRDANGLMLLGMSFVLSKQYSDDLSQKLTRGVRRRFLEEGKTPIRKHGYINEGGVYKPDGKNFDLICEAWEMRAKEDSLKKIAKYMNNQGYYSETKSRTKYEMSDKILSGTVFPDPFYYGVLIQSNHACCSFIGQNKKISLYAM